MSENKECALCDKALAVFGLIVAIGIAYIAIDIMAGGRITDTLKGGTEDGE